MKAKKKPLEDKSPADYGVDATPRLKTLKTCRAAGRKGGVKVADVVANWSPSSRPKSGVSA